MSRTLSENGKGMRALWRKKGKSMRAFMREKGHVDKHISERLEPYDGVSQIYSVYVIESASTDLLS
jgi:hypothetical protein